jgi:hypothetical protein
MAAYSIITTSIGMGKGSIFIRRDEEKNGKLLIVGELLFCAIFA